MKKKIVVFVVAALVAAAPTAQAAKPSWAGQKGKPAHPGKPAQKGKPDHAGPPPHAQAKGHGKEKGPKTDMPFRAVGSGQRDVTPVLDGGSSGDGSTLEEPILEDPAVEGATGSFVALDYTGTGEATRMDSITWLLKVAAATPSDASGCSTFTGTLDLVSLEHGHVPLTLAGHQCEVEADGSVTRTFTASYLVGTATGRFTGKTGSGTMTASEDLATGAITLSVRGTITR